VGIYDNGVSWLPIAKRTRNDGVHEWRVKKPVPSQARIRVSRVTDPSVFDVSDGNFTIQ
jgi:hypothetical protein